MLARAFDILGCFTGGEPERSVADICAVTDLPPATVHRMLATLSEHGAIERTGRGRYRLGPRACGGSATVSRTSGCCATAPARLWSTCTRAPGCRSPW
ncbi:hypothetical protein SHIRM173S_00814 [Streptomyces hirsutus]